MLSLNGEFPVAPCVDFISNFRQGLRRFLRHLDLLKFSLEKLPVLNAGDLPQKLR